MGKSSINKELKKVLEFIAKKQAKAIKNKNKQKHKKKVKTLYEYRRDQMLNNLQNKKKSIDNDNVKQDIKKILSYVSKNSTSGKKKSPEEYAKDKILMDLHYKSNNHSNQSIPNVRSTPANVDTEIAKKDIQELKAITKTDTDIAKKDIQEFKAITNETINRLLSGAELIQKELEYNYEKQKNPRSSPTMTIEVLSNKSKRKENEIRQTGHTITDLNIQQQEAIDNKQDDIVKEIQVQKQKQTNKYVKLTSEQKEINKELRRQKRADELQKQNEMIAEEKDIDERTRRSQVRSAEKRRKHFKTADENENDEDVFFDATSVPNKTPPPIVRPKKNASKSVTILAEKSGSDDYD